MSAGIESRYLMRELLNKQKSNNPHIESYDVDADIFADDNKKEE